MTLLLPNADTVPTGQALPDDLRWAGVAHLQRVHHLRHEQHHQALHVRPVRLGRRLPLPGRHQPLPVPDDPLQGGRLGALLTSCLSTQAVNTLRWSLNAHLVG